MNWPKHFPEGCPPSGLSEPTGTYYFLVSRTLEPPPRDFIPHAERDGYKPKGGRGSRCKDCALSVFVSREAIENFLINRGTALHNRVVAEMEVSEPYGKIRRDDHPEGHCGWWLYEGLSFRQFFVRCP
jgi:hypothetical protein